MAPNSQKIENLEPSESLGNLQYQINSDSDYVKREEDGNINKYKSETINLKYKVNCTQESIKTKLESDKTKLESITQKLQSDKNKLKSGISRLNSIDNSSEEAVKSKLEPVKCKLQSIVSKLESARFEMECDNSMQDYVNVQPESSNYVIIQPESCKTQQDPSQLKLDPGIKSDPPEAEQSKVITLWIEVHDVKVKLLEQWETDTMEVVMEHKLELKVWLEFGRWIRKNYIDQFLVEDNKRLQMVFDNWRQAPRTPWLEWTKSSRSLLRQFKHDSSCGTSSRCAYVCPSTKKDGIMS